MNQKQVIMILTDKCYPSLIKLHQQIKEACQDFGEVWFLYHQRGAPLPKAISQTHHFGFTDEVLTEGGYTPIEDGLIPGSNHFPLLKFFRQHPHYAHYWIIEDDVRFSGDWREFFLAYAITEIDFISSYLRSYSDDPHWWWWGSLRQLNQWVPLGKRIASFNPIYRISNQALQYLHERLTDQWQGHHEVLIPTLLYRAGYTLVDWGGDGSYVLSGQENQCYLGQKKTCPKDTDASTFRYRPVFEQIGNLPDKLYHPVKEYDEHSPVKTDKKENTIKNAVIAAVGKGSLHRKWLEGRPGFDLHLIVYDDAYEQFRSDTLHVIQADGAKFKLIYDYLTEKAELLESYDHFFLPDDDILIDAEAINSLFSYMNRYDLAVAQPGLSNSYYSHPHTRQQPNSALRYTNFVEIMQPCFSRVALKKVLFTFNESKSGWGIDYHWSQLVDYRKHNMAIIDDVPSVHTRPVQSRHFTELNQYLRKYRLERKIIPNYQ